jgi:hypothetical protein
MARVHPLTLDLDVRLMGDIGRSSVSRDQVILNVQIMPQLEPIMAVDCVGVLLAN